MSKGKRRRRREAYSCDSANKPKQISQGREGGGFFGESTDGVIFQPPLVDLVDHFLFLGPAEAGHVNRLREQIGRHNKGQK